MGLGFIAMVTSGGSAAAVGPRVGIVEVSGAIMDEGQGSTFSRIPGARDIIEDLEAARVDTNIKAVVVRVNSPGGSPSASKEIYRAIQRLKEDKPVICSMGDVAASGGYYVAVACDQIYANGSTLTGSIGVISQFFTFQDLFKKVGLNSATIKSGQFKDAGNPARNLTPAERQLFQQMIFDIYNQFVDDVAAGRKGKLTRNQILKLADGRVYTGRQALNNKLVDKEGGLYEAVAAAAKEGGIEGKPRTKNFSSGDGLGALFAAESSTSADQLVTGVGAAAGDAAGRAFVEQLRNQARNDVTTSAPQLR
jgi:protease-4